MVIAPPRIPINSGVLQDFLLSPTLSIVHQWYFQNKLFDPLLCRWLYIPNETEGTWCPSMHQEFKVSTWKHDTIMQIPIPYSSVEHCCPLPLKLIKFILKTFNWKLYITSCYIVFLEVRYSIMSTIIFSFASQLLSTSKAWSSLVWCASRVCMLSGGWGGVIAHSFGQ